jgi:hypothetical protein
MALGLDIAFGVYRYSSIIHVMLFRHFISASSLSRNKESAEQLSTTKPGLM